MTETKVRKLGRRGFLKGSLIAGGALIAGDIAYRSIAYPLRRDFDRERSEEFLEGIQAHAFPESLPNIILIIADDLGYGDLSVYGSRSIQTPCLDQMAAEGVRLTNFYATAPLCSPSRAGLLSGRYPVRTLVTMPLYPAGSPMDLIFNIGGVYPYDVRGIPEDEVLLPEALLRRGYRTGMLGKWHLGDRSPHLPTENGFEFFYGAYYSNDMKPYAIFRNTDVEMEAPADQDVLTQNFTREAIQFIRECGERPFFLYYAQPFPHVPLHASDQFRGRSQAGLYGDTVEELDWSVGEILKLIKVQGIDEKTLVIFTSDNGPWWQGSPGFTRGRKNMAFEGGFRVPFIARWPAVIPAGSVAEGMSMNFDLFSTCLMLAGIPLPQDRIIDGKDILPMLRGPAASPHDTLFFFKGTKPHGVRHGNWKYMRRHMTDNGNYPTLSQGPFLFNLELDPNESYSLIESEPEVASELEKMLMDCELQLRHNIRGWL
jgi:arylsulfatase A